MNAPRPAPPSDDEIATLLARRYRDTTADFEARWVALKRELRQSPPRQAGWRWPAWAGHFVLSGAVAALVIAFALGTREPPRATAAAGLSPSLAELFTLEAALGRAGALLDAETRDALLHLPVRPQTRR